MDCLEFDSMHNILVRLYIFWTLNRKDIQKAGAFYFGVRIPKENTYNGKIPLEIDGSDGRHLSRYF